MASVTSLGLHEPTALRYAIQEQLIEEDAPSSEYIWDITVDHNGDHAGEDELLITKESVTWSRGNIFRKSFGFKLEKEPVTQALLTYFPSSESTLSTSGRALSKALVVFLMTQAHIYFLDGTSHVVHIPFEVESACAAPQGVIIQRKQRNDAGQAASVKFPRVPPNSFISPQTSPVSMRTSQHPGFTTETLGRPKALPLRLNPTLDNVWDLPTERNDSHWPRLIALTDPILELGLVVTQNGTSSKSKNRRTSDKSPHFLDRAEEILHIEEMPSLGVNSKSRKPHDKLVLAVTVNRETSMYTVWRFTYIRNEDPFRAPKLPKKKVDRRRSSMQPGQQSGITSPLQANFKESFGTTLPGKRSRKSEKQEKVDKALETLESSLGLEKDLGAGRRTSRRVSSMLARADLSASQDRTAFSEQAQVPNHQSGRRETSHGSSRARTSGAFLGVSFSGTVTQSANPLGSFLEAPVDNLLEELRAGGDFEGFHSMGLDDHDFDGLTQEILLTKIHSVPVDNSNVRYSLSKTPARMQCKVFCLAGPQSVVDEQNRRQILVGIQDSMEKRLQLLTLHLQTSTKTRSTSESDATVVTFGQLRKAQNVIDSCKIVDGNISMILVLSDSGNGQRELSLQAPWSELTSITLPPKLSLSNVRSLHDHGSLVNREVGARRSITPMIGEIAGIRHPKLNGVVDILDNESQQLHQIRIQLQPTRPQVAKAFEVLSAVLPPSAGDRLLAGWWQIMNWLQREQIETADIEWSAFTIQILMTYLALGTNGSSSSFGTPTFHRRNRSLLRSSSGAQIDLSDWDTMNVFETPNSTSHPSWVDHRAWQWIMEEDDGAATVFQPSQDRQQDMDFLCSHLKHTQVFMASDSGVGACGQAGYLPTSSANSQASRVQHAQDIFVALHLLLEEEKLDITAPHATSPGPADLRALLLQVSRWLHWNQWAYIYELDMPVDSTDSQIGPSDVILSMTPPEPHLWSVFDWVQTCLTQDTGIVSALPIMISSMSREVLSRIVMFEHLFRALALKKRSPVDFVEAMYESGITPVVLESLPEAILVPLQDALAQCQIHPPPTWSKDLLELVDRSDVGSVLTPVEGNRFPSSNLKVSLRRLRTSIRIY